jgi:hypothetical protein
MDFRNPSAGVQGEIELQQTRKYTWSGQTQLTAASVEMPKGDRKVTNGTKKSLNLPCRRWSSVIEQSIVGEAFVPLQLSAGGSGHPE